jgi:anti-sigma factor RsiW
MAGHSTDHDLERYVLGMVKDEAELERLEEHLLACAECIDRAEQTRKYIQTMKAALAKLKRGV